MFLIAGSSFDLLRFFQILGWILVPVLLLSVLLTIILHYRKRKSKESDEDLITAPAEQIGYTRGDGEYVLFDHSPLIREYKQRLIYNHARYVALKHDFDTLEAKYAATFNGSGNTFNDSGKAVVSNRATPGIASMDHLVKQKNMQIEFLQQQLDARIQQQRAAEQQAAELDAQVLQQAAALTEKEAAIAELQKQVSYMESTFDELRQQGEILRSSAADSRDMVALLQSRIESENSEIARLRAELETRPTTLAAREEY